MANDKTIKRELYKRALALKEVQADEELVALFTNEIDLLAKKAARAHNDAVKKKDKTAELTDRVYNALSDDYQSLEDIIWVLNDSSISKAQVISSMTTLVNEGSAERAEAVVPDENGGRAHRIKVYRRI